MTTPILSIVIPTKNRRQILMTTLRALSRQRGLDGRFEVIVADDGSTDGSAELLRGTVFESFDLRVLVLDSGGPSRARNRAVAAAEADRVLFLGDDTVPRPHTVSAHLKASDDNRVAVQGRIDWDPEQTITDFMAYLAPAGPQFWFRGLTHGGPVPWTQVLGSNMSAPTRWLETEPYDERFTAACMEDTELAWRWARRGWTTRWSEAAICHHHHRYDSIDQFLDRQRRAGRWARFAVMKNPGMAFQLIVKPLLVTPWLAARAGAYKLIGRGRIRDTWNSQVRTAYRRGFFLES
jgi:glycosyltransferase involved in cell wall biosynthesis